MAALVETDFDVTIKVIVVGNGQVGKTSMITRFAKGVFTNEYKKTLAVDFLEKKLFVPAVSEEITYLLWDTAGQEEYDSITRGYYKGAGAAIIAFSTTDRASFDAVRQWHQKVKDECGEIPMVLVQNKVDLINNATMTASEAEDVARSLRLKLYRMCVKENMNIQQVFEDVGAEFVNRGGESGLGINSVTKMETYTTGTGGSQRAAPSNQDPNAPGSQQDKAFKVGGASSGATTRGPSSQRTGGKKRLFTQCAIL